MLLFCNVFSLSGQDSNWVRTRVARLSSAEFYGRGNCYDGEQKAADYIRSELLNLQAIPLGESGYQKYSFKSHKMEGAVTIAIKGESLNPKTDFRIAPFSHTLHHDLKVLRVPASILLDSEKVEKFRNKYQVVLAQSIVYIDNTKKPRLDDKESAQLQKALRELEYNNPFQSAGILIGVDVLPVWGLSSNHIERNYAIIYIVAEKMPRKIKQIRVDFTNIFITKETQNVCFAIEGTTVADTFMVFTAHYDHLGCMGDSVIFSGAHDNASGVAAVMDFAHYYHLNPPKYTMVFLLFSGEESGLRGSTYFSKNPLIPFNQVRMLINLDMFCGGDEGIMVVNAQSDNTKPFFDKLLEINNEQHLVANVKQRANAANSDHYPFSSLCPALFIYTLGGRIGGYHNYTDTCDNCSLENYSRIFQLINTAIQAY